MIHSTSIRKALVLSLVLFATISAPLLAQKKPGSRTCEIAVSSELDSLGRIAGDALGAYVNQLQGVRSVFCDGNFILSLQHYSASTRRNAFVDLSSPAEAGAPSLGTSFNSSLQMNVRGGIATMEIGEIRGVDAIITFTRDADRKSYRINFSGANGTDLVRVERVSATQWTATAAPGSRARVWDVSKAKAVLVGLYNSDFALSLNLP
jgi:hypothetical protein